MLCGEARTDVTKEKNKKLFLPCLCKKLQERKFSAWDIRNFSFSSINIKITANLPRLRLFCVSVLSLYQQGFSMLF